jgi:NiFe hydrogenase small subunit HydA
MSEKHEVHHHFLERARSVASHLKLSEKLIPHITRHLHHFTQGTSPIIWIQGQNCTGCTVALMNSDHFDPFDLCLDKIYFAYHPDLMTANGQEAEEIMEDVEAETKDHYILVIEGAIPMGEGEDYCSFGLEQTSEELMGRTVPKARTIYDWLRELVPGSAAVIAIGNCAAFGGIPAANAEVTKATAAPKVVAGMDKDKPVICVAGCPPHPDWLMGTILDVLLWIEGIKERPELDERGCLKRFYQATIHENCERKPCFDNKEFLLDWNDSDGIDDLCLIKMGCRGLKAHADCPLRRWNSATSWCVGVNAPCHGCTEPGFYRRLPHGPK